MKIKNFLTAVTLTAVLCFCGVVNIAASERVKLVAANYSDRYHVSTCKIAQNISEEDLMTFETPEQAIQAGFRPCRKCYPPTETEKNQKKFLI